MRVFMPAAFAVAALVSFSAASEASDCLRLHRVRTEVVSAVDGTAKFVRRVGDRAFGWIFCNKGV